MPGSAPDVLAKSLCVKLQASSTFLLQLEPRVVKGFGHRPALAENKGKCGHIVVNILD